MKPSFIRVYSFRYLVLWITAFLSLSLLSHIEPGKTGSERKESEKERLRIKSSRIKSLKIYKNIIINDSLTLEKYLYQVHDYDTNGNVISIKSYKSKDVLEYTVLYKYDPNNNLVEDIDLDSTGQIKEKLVHEYSGENLLTRSTTFNEKHSKVSVFEYATLNQDSVVRCIKKVFPADTVEYLIDYRYPGFSDTARLIAARKYLNNLQITRIENKYNKKGQRTQKTVFNHDDSLQFKWLYYYDLAGNNTRIVRMDSLSKFEYAIDRNFDEFRNVVKLRKINTTRKFSDYQTFEYEYYK